MEDVLAQAQQFRTQFGATKTLLTGNDLDLLQSWIQELGAPILVATPHQAAPEQLAQDGVDVMLLSHRVGGGINSLRTIRDVLLAAYVEGRLDAEERLFVAQLGDEAGHAFMAFDMKYDESVAKMRKDLEYRADVRVVEATLQIASDLAREGRENHPVGALFIVGDAERVMSRSRQVVLNPFHGHDEVYRNILDSGCWETVKEFAQIDGAIVIDDDGLVEAAGRYIEVRDPTDLPSGLGGRHLAAAAVTNESKAIAITVSETGVVRIFRDGKILLRIGVT